MSFILYSTEWNPVNNIPDFDLYQFYLILLSDIASDFSKFFSIVKFFWQHAVGLYYFLIQERDVNCIQVKFEGYEGKSLTYVIKTFQMMNFNWKISSKQNKTFPRCQNVKNSLYMIYILLLGIALVRGESDAAELENTVIAVY